MPPRTEPKKGWLRRLVTNLTFWVLLAITAGILLGHFHPALAVKMEPLGKAFISVVKVFINPLIMVTIILGIAGAGSLKKVGKVGGKALLYFEIVTTAALLIGIAAAYLIRPGSGLVPPEAGGAGYAGPEQDFSWWAFIKENVTLQVLLLSILAALVIGRLNKRELILHWVGKASRYLFRALHWVMLLAPLGAFGGMAFTIGRYGLQSLVPLAKLMATVYLTMALFIFGVLGLLLRYYRVSLLRFLNYIKEELLIVLGTSSSEAALPPLMDKLQRMGCSKPVVGLVVPAGYSFNLDGTTIYLSMATLFLAQVYGVELTTTQLLTIIGVLMVTSKGAAGVTGSGFIILASTLSAVKVVPVEGLALLLGVDRFMSEARAITNFIGNGVATVFIANHEHDFDRGKMEAAFSKEVYEYEEDALKT